MKSSASTIGPLTLAASPLRLSNTTAEQGSCKPTARILWPAASIFSLKESIAAISSEFAVTTWFRLAITAKRNRTEQEYRHSADRLPASTPLLELRLGHGCEEGDWTCFIFPID